MAARPRGYGLTAEVKGKVTQRCLLYKNKLYCVTGGGEGAILDCDWLRPWSRAFQQKWVFNIETT